MSPRAQPQPRHSRKGNGFCPFFVITFWRNRLLGTIMSNLTSLYISFLPFLIHYMVI